MITQQNKQIYSVVQLGPAGQVDSLRCFHQRDLEHHLQKPWCPGVAWASR